jgi:hypothetical protein
MFKHFNRSKLNISKKILNVQKKNMSSNNIFDSIPTWTKRIVILNTCIFGVGMAMSNREYITNFFYNKYALRHNRIHVLITSHFAKTNFIDYLLDTVITGLLGSQVESMIGSQSFLRLTGLSMCFGSILLIYKHNDNTFFKTECILRSIIWYIILSNPNQSFILFPLPIPIKAMWIGFFTFFIDVVGHRWANFGGLLAALIIARRLL